MDQRTSFLLVLLLLALTWSHVDSRKYFMFIVSKYGAFTHMSVSFFSLYVKFLCPLKGPPPPLKSARNVTHIRLWELLY